MRILVVKLTSMGDVIHALPAITDAAKQIENLQVDWLVEESFQAIPGWHPAIDNIFTAATRRWRKQPGKFILETSNLRKQLSTKPYDLIIDAQGLLKSAVLARYAKGKRVGYDKYSIKESIASRFYHSTIRVDRNQHAVARIRSLFAQALNYTIPDSLDYGLSVNQFEQNSNSDYLVFLHGTTWSSKQWPVQKWQNLINIAAKNNLRVKLLWGNEKEFERANEIAQTHGDASVCPKLSLDEIASLLSNSKGAIAVDTGLGHLAAALSVPCISLYGATDSRRTGTIGAFQKHLQAEFECSPCLLKDCNFSGRSDCVPACFDQFTAEYVWQQFEQLTKEQN